MSEEAASEKEKVLGRRLSYQELLKAAKEQEGDPPHDEARALKEFFEQFAPGALAAVKDFCGELVKAEGGYGCYLTLPLI